MDRFQGWFAYNLWLLIPVVLFIINGFIQGWYYLGVYNGINRQRKRGLQGKVGNNQQQPPVSIIVCANNQAQAIADHLPLWLEQSYPVFQVVIVNEDLDEATEEVLKQYETDPRVYHTFVPKELKSISLRKMAMTIGIKAAAYDYVVFAGASCQPASNRWLASLMQYMDDSTPVVLGYVTMGKIKGFLHRFIAYDNLFTALQYMGFALKGWVYKANTNNLAFKKELFFTNKGFSSHLYLQSGDDDLLISEIAKNCAVQAAVSEDSLQQLVTVDARHEWLENMIKHISTRRHYRFSVRCRLAFELITRYVFYALLIYTIVVGMIQSAYGWVAVALLGFLIRYVIQLSVINRTASSFKEPRWFFTLPFLDLLLPLIQWLFRLFYKPQLKNTYTWEVVR